MYMKNKTDAEWKKIIEEENSLTKKMLTKYLIQSASLCNFDFKQSDLDKIYITNAIMCARSGDNYRGDNIKLKESTLNCSEFLTKQIEIVKPKIILTLGYYPLLSLSQIFNFKIGDNLTNTIENKPIITIEEYIIIPLYHPTAQIKKEKQLEQYMRIWEYL